MSDFSDNQNSPTSIYAGFWVRIAAAVIDMIVTAPIVWAVLYLVGIDMSQLGNDQTFMESLNHVPTKEERIADFISWSISIAYSVYFLTSKRQATIGKQLMNIYIGTVDGAKLTVNRAFARFFASLLSLLLFGIGVLMIAFTKEKTGLHDLICGTRVFYGKKE